MTEKIHHTITIPPEYGNERLDQVLAKLMPNYSRTQLKTWIDAGNILIDGKTAQGKLKVKGCEVVSIEATPRVVENWIAENIPLTIVYEDDDVLVVNKPVGMVVHPGAGNASKTLLNALLHHAPALKTLPRAGILHRLDKDTSGLLVVAKNEEALRLLGRQLKKRKFLREYQAIVHGKLISGGKVDAPLFRHPQDRKRMAVVETGRPSITHYRVMEKYRAHTRLKVQLETGRTHQIRVHMAYIRHPIVGDATYGMRMPLTKGASANLVEALKHFKHQALHAFTLGFTHPTTSEWMQFECDIPDDMQHLIDTLKEDAKQ